MKAYEIHSDRQGIEALILVERPEPTLQAGQVLVRMHAASLNFRDIQILRGTYGMFQKLVAATQEPFVQAILALGVPQMAFGRVGAGWGCCLYSTPPYCR